MTDFPKRTLADWEALARKELRDRPLGSLDWMTPEGIAVKPHRERGRACKGRAGAATSFGLRLVW